jgi:predicted acetyltransferase
MFYSPNDTRLVMPSEIYARSYQAAIMEGFAADPQAPPPGPDAQSLAAHLAWLNAPNVQIVLPNGRRALRVPQLEAWLTHAYTFIGRAIIRLRLTPELEALGGHIDVAIRPSLQGRGFGAHLFAQALAQARAGGVRRVVLTCLESNEAAVRLFERQRAAFVDRIAHPYVADAVVRRYVIED